MAIAGSTGHVKGLKGRTKLLAPVMFNIIFPLARITKGYGPTQAIGMGENLPKDVAREWAEFCSKPGYIINAIGKRSHQHMTIMLRSPARSHQYGLRMMKSPLKRMSKTCCAYIQKQPQK